MSLPQQSRIGVSLPMLNQPYERYAQFVALLARNVRWIERRALGPHR